MIGPLRHAIDPDWLRRHSTDAYWSEIKISIHRLGWSHDDGWPAGFYGDAEFMNSVMSHTHADDDISSCMAGHRDNAFRMISNHDLGEDAAAWLRWWSENKSKSQVEWIRDGFAVHGVIVNIPPEPSDAEPLLRLLGNTSTNESDQIHDFLKYNAFRWLRDSDFNPVAFAISNVTDSTEPTVKAGLLEYLERERAYPKRDRVGVLVSAEEVDPFSDYDLLPPMADPRFKAAACALLIGLPALGLLLLGLSFVKRKHRNVEQTPPPH